MTTDDAVQPQPARITDPSRVRALAHPLRLELLEYLGDVGEATASECAAHTGETVANCSFHLRTLARAGYLEEAPRRGRERPWRCVATSQTLDIEPGSAESHEAVSEMVGLAFLREAERMRTFFARSPDRPAEWAGTVTLTSSKFWATADELRELVDAVLDLASRFADRDDNPALRPSGARQARLFATVNPDDFPRDEPTAPTVPTGATVPTGPTEPTDPARSDR